MNDHVGIHLVTGASISPVVVCDSTECAPYPAGVEFGFSLSTLEENFMKLYSTSFCLQLYPTLSQIGYD